MSELKQKISDRLHEVNLNDKPSSKELELQSKLLDELTEEDIIELAARKVFFNAALTVYNEKMASVNHNYPKGGIK